MLNNITIIGRLVHAPELKFIAGSGTAVATFTIAVERDYKQENQPSADFFGCVVWKKLGENCANYLVKGQMCAVKGRLQNRKYTTKAGDERTVTEIIAENVQFLEKPKGAKSESENTNEYDNRFGSDITPIDDGDIPF